MFVPQGASTDPPAYAEKPEMENSEKIEKCEQMENTGVEVDEVLGAEESKTEESKIGEDGGTKIGSMKIEEMKIEEMKIEESQMVKNEDNKTGTVTSQECTPREKDDSKLLVRKTSQDSSQPSKSSKGGLMKQLRSFGKKVSQIVTSPAHVSPSWHSNENQIVKRVIPRHRPVRYIGAYCDSAFVCGAIQHIWRILYEAQAQSPYAKVLLGVSGGSTPQKIFTTLSTLSTAAASGECVKHVHSNKLRSYSITGELPAASEVAEVSENSEVGNIDWSRVVLFLVDERYVPSDHKDSNQKLVRESLLSGAGVNIPEDQLIFPDTSKPIADCIEDYSQRLRQVMAVTGRPTLVTLGMGDDGHIASWFPPMDEQMNMTAHDKHHLAVHTMQNRFAVTDRITVSMDLICSSEEKLFLLSGESKIKKWKELISLDATNVVKEPLLQVVESEGITVMSHPPIIADMLSTFHANEEKSHLTVVVFGASGDLARKKTLPALFSLFCEGYMPHNFHVVGYARTKMSEEAFWEKLEPNLLKLESFFKGSRRYQKALMSNDNLGFLTNFRKRLSYVAGSYDKREDFERLSTSINSLESQSNNWSTLNRLFYLALPPNVFASTVQHSRVCCWSPSGWNRVVVEKPFGRDLDSAMELANTMLKVLKESETFRIDHYLGKEMVLNLSVIRFANSIFSPLMSWQHISAVRITFKEDIGTDGRGGYFDEFGIIRDIMQNHLMQILTIVAMERPASLSDDDVRDEKVKVLKSFAPINKSEIVIGQYTKSADGSQSGYLEDKTVPAGSICPTFCTAVLHSNNERWAGVPFILKAGKALEEKATEIRIQFRPVPGNLFGSEVPQNELVVKVQPDEAIYVKLMTKKPGLAEGLQQTELDLSVMDRFDIERLPDAYERLMLDVMKGDKQNFVRTDELREAWRIFTPILHELESAKVKPIPYPAGSTGPSEAYDLIKKAGYVRYEGYSWNN